MKSRFPLSESLTAQPPTCRGSGVASRLVSRLILRSPRLSHVLAAPFAGPGEDKDLGPDVVG
jgi:hypothetical protein